MSGIDTKVVEGPMTEDLASMIGKVCLITGGTGGIGLEISRGLARAGAQVIAVARDRERGTTSADAIRRQTGNDLVTFVQADLSSLAEVRRLAEAVKASCPRLDVLVNNVGGFFLRGRRTADGFEATYALNYLGVFLLTNLLFDLLRRSAPSRVVNVASDSHRSASLSVDALDMEHGRGGMRAYGRSKLALVLFTYEAARRMQGTGVTINALHPGFVATNIQRGASPLAGIATPFIRRIARTPVQGADTAIYLSRSEQVRDVSGQYFFDRRLVASSPISRDRQLAEILWERTGPIVGLRGMIPDVSA